MKSYSFIRENAVKVLRPWTKDDRDGPNVMYNGQMSPTVGSFYKYAYFLFAPTLLYRDHYPRYTYIHKHVHYMIIIVDSSQSVGRMLELTCYNSLFCPLLFLSIYHPLCLHHSSKTNKVFNSCMYVPITCRLVDLTKSYCFSLLLSIVTTWLCSLVVLHTWLNAHAELTTFADRQFYTVSPSLFVCMYEIICCPNRTGGIVQVILYSIANGMYLFTTG